MRWARVARITMAVLVPVTMLGLATWSADGRRDQEPLGGGVVDTRPGESGAWLGLAPDWSTDGVRDTRARLGRSPALVVWEAGYPLDPSEAIGLRSAVAQARSQGSSVLVSLAPQDAATAFDPGLGDRVVEDLRVAGLQHDDPFWLRPLPEMNGPWQSYGQQPQQAVAAFRRIAGAVHDAFPSAAVVWQPAYAAGYPFDPTGATPAETSDSLLDTDADGRLSSFDDPYGPYFPGLQAVDWVGVSALHFGVTYPYGDVDLPAPGELNQLLAGSFGAPDARPERDLLARFAVPDGLPVLLETGALWITGGEVSEPGLTEVQVKEAWADQVASVLAAQGSLVQAVVWREVERPESEVGDQVVDWRITADPRLRRVLQDTLLDPGLLRTGPSGPPRPLTATSADALAGAGRGTVLSRSWSLAVVGLTALALLGVVVLARSRRLSSWSYQAWVERTGHPAARDLRVDLLRGVAICFVVVNHLFLPSLVSLVSEEALGPFSGAEVFVLLSGVVLGGLHARRARGGASLESSWAMLWRRAGTLYLVSLVATVLVWLVVLVPGVDGRSVTTFTDRGTGQVFDLYASVRGVAAGTQVVRDVVLDLVMLDIGPFQINILGLYVALLLLAPLAVLCLRRRWWLPLLVGSVVVWAVSRPVPVRLLPSEFEDGFPLMVWQLLFVIGLVIGWHRDALTRAARTPWLRGVVWLAVLTWFLLLVFAWCNPYLSNAADLRLSLVDPDRFGDLYTRWFGRPDLGAGRVLAAVCGTSAAYVLLTRFWWPVHRALGWALVPMGQATLYLFVLQLPLVLLVDELPLEAGGLLTGTLVDLAVLGALLLMLRTRFLFRLVPR